MVNRSSDGQRESTPASPDELTLEKFGSPLNAVGIAPKRLLPVHGSSTGGCKVCQFFMPEWQLGVKLNPGVELAELRIFTRILLDDRDEDKTREGFAYSVARSVVDQLSYRRGGLISLLPPQGAIRPLQVWFEFRRKGRQGSEIENVEIISRGAEAHRSSLRTFLDSAREP